MKDDDMGTSETITGFDGPENNTLHGAVKGLQEKENVSFLGIQKIPKGGMLVLVNNGTGSTIVFDPQRHNIINIDGYVRFAIAAFQGGNT